jgi:Pyruvate phosphate dikinase, AMP/ATP-binding domain
VSRAKWVYDFAEGSREMRDPLGGKGANVAEMTRVLGADRVPAGFTITTEACVALCGRAGAIRRGWRRRWPMRWLGWRRTRESGSAIVMIR